MTGNPAQDEEVNSEDHLQVSSDTDWYETSITVSKSDKVIEHISREVARALTNFLKFKGKVSPVMYNNEIGGIRNKLCGH